MASTENQLMLSYTSDEVPDLSISDTELQIRSWSMFAVLLSIGRPVPPTELASRCTSVEASQEFVEFVCSLPNSPLSLTSDGLVTISSAVCIVLQRFLLNSGRFLEFLLHPEMMMREFGRKRGLKDVGIMCSRKRRRLWPDFYERADQSALTIPFSIPNDCEKVYIHLDDIIRSLIKNTGTGGISQNSRMSPLIKFDAGYLDYRSNGDHENEKEIATVSSLKEFGSMNSFSTSIPGGLKDCFQLDWFSHLTESINGESCLINKRDRASSFHANDNSKVISLVKAWIDNNSSKVNNNSPERQRFVEGREYECIPGSESHKGNHEKLSCDTVHGGMIPKLNCGNSSTLCCNDMIPCSGRGEKASCQEVGEKNIASLADAEKLCSNEAPMDDLQEEKTICGREEQLVCSLFCEQDHEKLDMTCKDERTRESSVKGEQISTDADLDLMNPTRELLSFDQKHFIESTAKTEAIPKDTNSTLQTVSIKPNKGNDGGFLIEQKHGKKDKRSASMKQKIKPTCEQTTPTFRKRENIKENKEKAPTISGKGHLEEKQVPLFDSYIVEEEEGSGGYGTVYKARRKKDGTMFAIKYPHVNANRQHVYNELKMLERFGGKNFVIKYEGSFKSGNSQCLVLEHVAHDRPEVLKREIDVFQLRWYGYCLFRALASLHKQGVVHRDVKPGNFLFSCKASKGYLIDFNLATDLYQKLGPTGKSKSHIDAGSKLVPPPHPDFVPPSRSSKYISSKALAAETHSKMLFPKTSKKKKDNKELNMHGVMKSQGADGSGITSTKEANSTKVISGERFREPIPCIGRKEYLNLVQEALQSPDHEAAITTTNTTVSKRKRVAAPPAKLDNKFLYLTPMPLHSIGAGLLKTKGDGKQRKEGPCVGTKGFRAPEVLFKSTYQGPKVDIWSAGVTLLYLIIGRTPFVGDPDQNIKEIAKLRGSEDLWEVAKLHDRESSFPPELLQIQSLTSTKLVEWCKQNTRRVDFLEAIPNSLIDLVDKCLTVNPRSRISAEEALRHEFFVPCFNELEKQRQLRQTRFGRSNSLSVSCKSSPLKN